MENNNQIKGTSTRMRLLQLVLLCIAGILVNRLGSILAARLGLPLYLDCLGTVLVAALGGYIPGIVVGYVINLINGISDGASAYSGVLSVIIAVVTVIISDRGWFRKVTGCVGAIVIYALIGGGLGSVLTWFLYGMGFGDGVSAALAHSFYASGLGSVFFSQFAADFLVDLLDKAIIVALAAVILRLLPEDWGRRMRVILWRQRPLSREEQAQARHMRTRGSSLRIRIIVLLSAALLIVVAVTVGICFALYHDATIQNESYMAMGVANVAADAIDPDRVGDFLTRGHAAPGYDATEERLVSIRDSSPDIEYIYAYLIREDGCHVVFDPDTPDLPGEKPGTVIPFDESFLPMLSDLLAGREIEPIVTNDSYGWLLTVYHPMYDSTGRCVCYVGVDISMLDLINNESSFIAKALSLFVSFALLIIAIGIWLADSRLILPLNSMTLAAEKFAYGEGYDEGMNVEAIRSLDIHTGDEIETLYRAFAKTSGDMVQYVRDVEEKNATITRMQDSLIAVLADMVESRDKHTGHHVKKTAAYARIIMEQMRREGVHTDVLNEEYIDTVVRSAPLHDVGKIEVPDALLNKPGKLTDEEFAIMKSHPQKGYEILKNVKIQEDLAQGARFHHERFDGKGYPTGISGLSIPWVARIISVADTFDAMSSTRPYRKKLPLEFIVEEIKKCSGTQFDPKVVEAFLALHEEGKFNDLN